MASTARLYTPEVLALATGLAATPFDPEMPFQGSARSASCGSSLDLSLSLDEGGRIDRTGLRARACAIGQASAAIFLIGAVGRSRGEIAEAADRLAAWLSGGAAPPWPGIETLAEARDFPGRHGAIMLPWKAALAALPTT